MAGKASGMFSKVGGQIANAATLGFGATRKYPKDIYTLWCTDLSFLHSWF
jgi:hypothetical protein